MKFKKGLAFLLAMALGFSPVMVSAAELDANGDITDNYYKHTFSTALKDTEATVGSEVSMTVEINDEAVKVSGPGEYESGKGKFIGNQSKDEQQFENIWEVTDPDGEKVTLSDPDFKDEGKTLVFTPDKKGVYKVDVQTNPWWVVKPAPEDDDSGNLYIKSSAEVTVTEKGEEVESVTVKPDSATLKVGETTKLTATVTPAEASQDVTWKSDDEKVATVKDGTVTAVGVGKTKITATSVKDTSKSASATITVEDGTVKVESVKVEPKTATVAPSKTVQLKATVAPEGASQEVEYKSSDEKIATVDKNGLVTGVAVGTATITVTSTDDSSKSDTAEITVKEDVAPTEVKVTGSDKVLKTGGTKQLKAEVLPAEASQEVNWSSSKKSVATVDENGKVTAKGSGTATITATSAVDEKIKATFKVKVAGMEFDTTDLTMKAGDKKTIKITFTNDSLKSAKVTSDKKKIIDGKVVTGSKKLTIKAKKNKKGTATITVKSNAGLSQKITVNVQKDNVTTKKIELYNNSGKKKSAISVKKGKKVTYTIKATPDKVSTGETVKISKKPNSKYAKATINKDGKLVVTGVKATGNNKVFLKLKAGKKEAKFNIKVTK